MEGITNNLCKAAWTLEIPWRFVSIRFWRQTQVLACVCLGKNHWNERGAKKIGHAKQHLRSISCSQLPHSQFLSISFFVLRIRYIWTNIAKVMHVILHSSTSITPNQRSIWRFEASQSMYLTSGDERPLRWIPLILKAENLPTLEEASRILRDLPLADSLPQYSISAHPAT